MRESQKDKPKNHTWCLIAIILKITNTYGGLIISFLYFNFILEETESRLSSCSVSAVELIQHLGCLISKTTALKHHVL
jgi:hypothetical protein